MLQTAFNLPVCLWWF